MAEILEHNEGDLTAVLQAGVPLAEAQALFAEAGQMFALDPPLGAGDADDDRRPRGLRRLRARCATATAACATSCSASRSRCPTARWRRRAAR